MQRLPVRPVNRPRFIRIELAFQRAQNQSREGMFRCSRFDVGNRPGQRRVRYLIGSGNVGGSQRRQPGLNLGDGRERWLSNNIHWHGGGSRVRKRQHDDVRVHFRRGQDDFINPGRMRRVDLDSRVRRQRRNAPVQGDVNADRRRPRYRTPVRRIVHKKRYRS